MKRFLLQIVMLLTSFNLAGGYAIAAGVINQASRAHIIPDTHLSEGFVVKKKTGTGVEIQVPQINKEESEEDDSYGLQQLSLLHSIFDIRFIPDFKLFNKHFLVHYGKAIKSSLPVIYLLNSVFRL